MKIKIFEEYTGPESHNDGHYKLSTEQVGDLSEEFDDFIHDLESETRRRLSPDDIYNMFHGDVEKTGELSEYFLKFLNRLESNLDWFDFRMLDKIENDISILISEYGSDEDEFDGFAEDDENWPEDKTIDDKDSGNVSTLGEDEEDDGGSDIEELKKRSYDRYSRESNKMNIDDILDKISSSGIGSLTPEERQFLDKNEGTKIKRFKNWNSL